MHFALWYMLENPGDDGGRYPLCPEFRGATRYEAPFSTSSDRYGAYFVCLTNVLSNTFISTKSQPKHASLSHTSRIVPSVFA